MMCLKTRNDVLEMKEKMLLQNQNEEFENGDESGEEGSTHAKSADMDEDESEEDVVAEESNSDMLFTLI